MNPSNKQANLSLQVIPINEANAYPIIDKAIEVIQHSGVKYAVQPFATIMEGELNQLIEVVLQAKAAAFEAGAEELVLNVQIHVKKNQDVSFADKTEKFKD